MINIFAGTAISLVDNDRRCAFPKCFRKALDKDMDGDYFFVTCLVDDDGKYLKLYTATEWERVESNVSKMVEDARMDLASPSSQLAFKMNAEIGRVKRKGSACTLDKNNRITLSEHMLKWIGLENKGEIVFEAGLGKTLRLVAKVGDEDPLSIDPKGLVDVSRFLG